MTQGSADWTILADHFPELWNPLTEAQRQLLMSHFHILHFERNEMIYAEGDTPIHLLCLLNGKVKIFKEGFGRSQIVRVLKEQEYFGYRAWFAKENYVTSAAAFEPCTLCLIPMETILGLLKENNQLAIFFIEQLSKDLGISDVRTVSLTQKHIRARLAESLLLLKQNYGTEADGHTLSIYLSRDDLASLSNMTTSNAIRTLSSFAYDKLIAIDGRKIKLIDEDALRRICQTG